jgi:myo-inositol-1-phosphate synthase
VGLTTDLDGNPRPVDGDKSGVAQPDMGCYEYQANEFACDFATTNARVGLNALSNVVFTAAVDGTGSATNIVYYWWTFGAGTTPQEGPNLAMVSNTFLYGRYDVSLTVSNELGQVTSAAKVDYIRVVAENAFVSTNGTGQYPYETWAKATTNPVLALSALSLAVGSGGAATGDLWISNGVFDVTAELALNGPYRLHGMNGASNTVLRRNATPKYRVLSLTHAAALAEGLTITNGYNEADGAVSGHGGGVYMTNGILRDCILIGNRHAPAPGLGEARGGGVCLMGGLVSNCVVRNNRAYASNWNAGKGGGVYAGGGTVRECRIEGNDAQGCGGSYPGNAYGGGLYLSNSASAYNCLIRTNRLQRYSTEEKGGGVYVAGGTLLHCTVVENLGVMGMSGTAGGGIFQAGGGVTNCIVYFNLSTNLASDFGSSGGNEAYSCAPELTTGTGNRSEDPLFVARTNLDYHLTRSSPCLEGGTNVSSLAVDLDGNPRLVDGDKSGVVQPDMGCYEYQGGEFACDFATTNARIGLNALSNVVFTASADGIGSATNIVNYWWDFGAGTTPQTGPGLAVVSNTFLCGRYDVSLTVSNALGQVTSASKADYIRVVAENAYVSTNGTGQYPYETWAKATTNPVLALSTLSLAVGSAGATAGDLWISNGVFGVTAELALSGPFRLHGMNGASNTVLRRSGAAYYRVLNLTHAGALAEGVTVTNGYVNIDDATQGGGGIWMTNGIVRNCVIAGNTRAPGGVDGQGGGVYMTGGVLSNCIVRGNYAIGGYFKHGYGGGVYAGGGTIRECRIEGNRLVGYFDNSYGGDAYGGGLYMTGSPEAWNNLIASNSVQRATNSSSAGTVERGGGVFVNGGTLLNCTVVDNRGVRGTITAGAGGGVYQAGGTVRNCIVYANLSSNTANDFVFTAGARDYSCAPELTTGVNNNTSADPQFMRRAGADFYRLTFGSPCMNSGTNLAWMTNAVDFEGYARILGGRVNMGAYEYVLPMGTGFIFR